MTYLPSQRAMEEWDVLIDEGMRLAQQRIESGSVLSGPASGASYGRSGSRPTRRFEHTCGLLSAS